MRRACLRGLLERFERVGEEQRARDLMERLLREASPRGLYAEQLDPDS